jgi:hypothetical protein
MPGRGSPQSHNDTKPDVRSPRLVRVERLRIFWAAQRPQEGTRDEDLACCFRAAVVATILAALSVAGEPAGVATNPDRAAATRPRCEPGAGPVRARAAPALRARQGPRRAHPLPLGGPASLGSDDRGPPGRPRNPGNVPIPDVPISQRRLHPLSAHLLRQSRRAFDPHGTDAAFERMVVVGQGVRRSRRDRPDAAGRRRRLRGRPGPVCRGWPTLTPWPPGSRTRERSRS